MYLGSKYCREVSCDALILLISAWCLYLEQKANGASHILISMAKLGAPNSRTAGGVVLGVGCFPEMGQTGLRMQGDCVPCVTWDAWRARWSRVVQAVGWELTCAICLPCCRSLGLCYKVKIFLALAHSGWLTASRVQNVFFSSKAFSVFWCACHLVGVCCGLSCLPFS